ncbi:MAG: hypothetical protein FVQ77_06985 [Cytophagales bacterium]|nr:hypothetical protein [Cytophagales bacterium]
MKLRIHGDNIIECERTLELIVRAYGATVERISDNLYCPQFRVNVSGNAKFDATLYSGHGRWGTSIQSALTLEKAPIREATDAYITKEVDGNEEIVLAIEYCNALPAGNNAWQRSGRAVTCAELGIPYFYYAEVGGVELDENRVVKAPRFPNPIVPFSYLSASVSLDVVCLPVYEAHPAITEDLRNKFQLVFGLEDSLVLLKAIIDGNNHSDAFEALKKKGLSLVRILAKERKRIDTLKGKQWDEFLDAVTGKDRAEWLATDDVVQKWKRKRSGKVNVTRNFDKLSGKIKKIDCISIGAKEIPICLISKDELREFVKIFKTIYGKDVGDFINELKVLKEPLVVVWITGFKPRGDDSRPDRGLVPLARMVFGNDIKILTIVSGPAIKSTWDTFKTNPARLAETNGLWEAILNLSNMVFADSTTSKHGPLYHIEERAFKKRTKKISIPISNNVPNHFSEYDVDTVLHVLFSHQEKHGIYEAMCNPPGGDWSGILVFDKVKKQEYKWTSLPRVSGSNRKRPDCAIQLYDGDEIYIAMESKNVSRDLEKDVGTRLNMFLKDILCSQPNAYRSLNGEWRAYTDSAAPVKKFQSFSAGAFCYGDDSQLVAAMKKGKLDIAIALEFKGEKEVSILHLKTSKHCGFFANLLMKIAEQFSGGIEVKIH